MERNEIIELGKRLPIGTKRRTECCGSGRTLVINRDIEHVWWNCFRCKQSGQYNIQPTLAEIQAREAAVQGYVFDPANATRDLVDDLPGHAVAFLVGRGLWPALYQNWCKWNPKTERLTMLMQWQGQVEGVLMRDTSVGRPKPKYVQRSARPYVTPTFIVGVYARRIPAGCTVVVTEDALSACKVSLASASTVGFALIGTHATGGALARIAELSPSSVALWLDPDRAGKEAIPAIVRSLSLMGLNTRVIAKGGSDPKVFDVRTIREVIHNSYLPAYV